MDNLDPHAKNILRDARSYERHVVVVECPHGVGLCYLDDDESAVSQLPCTCNFRSFIVGFVLHDPEVLNMLISDKGWLKDGGEDES